MNYRDNSKWWRNILTPKGRASRLEYNLLCVIVCLPLVIMVILDFNRIYSFTKNENALYYLMGYVVVIMYLMICAMIRRNHDLGNPGLTRNSLFGSEYMFKKGVYGPNRFGSDPCRDYLTQIDELNAE